MHFANILSTVAIAALSATTVAAVEHGDVTVYDGAEVKWQQLGKGMWTGIPVNDWDEGGEYLYRPYRFHVELTSTSSS